MFYFPLVSVALLFPIPSEGLIGRIGSATFRSPVDAHLVGVSSDGKRFYTATYSFSNKILPTVFVWDCATGLLLTRHTIGESGDVVYETMLGSGGLRLAVTNKSGLRQLRVVDPDTGRTLSSTEPLAEPPFRREVLGGRIESEHFGSHGWVYRSDAKGYHLRDAVHGNELNIGGAMEDQFATAMGIRRDGKVFYIVPLKTHPARFFELPSGKPLLELPKPEDMQSFGGFTPDGNRCVMWSKQADGWAFDIWDIATKTKQTVFDKQQLPGRVVFAPDGKTFARLPIRDGAYHPGGEWEVRAITDGRVLSRFPAEAYVGQIAFSPDGKTLFMQSGSRMIVPWDVATGKPKASAPVPLGEVKRFRFTATDQLVGLAGGFVYTWEVPTGKELSRTRVPTTPDDFYGIRFNANGDRLLFVDFTTKLTAWDYRTGAFKKMPIPPPGFNSAPTEVFTTDGSLQISGGREIVIRSVASGSEVIRQFPPEWTPGRRTWPNSITERAVSANGELLALASVDHRPDPDKETTQAVVTVFGVKHEIPPRSVVLENFQVTSLAFSPDGRLLVVGGGGIKGGLRVFDASTLRAVTTIANLGVVPHGLAFSPDGRIVAMSAAHHEVRLMETASWRERIVLPSPMREHQYGWSNDHYRDLFAFSPDGRRLATAMPDGGLLFWDTRKLWPKSMRPDAVALDAAWTALAGENAQLAHKVIGTLAQYPDVSLPFLKAKLPVTVGPDAKQIATQVALLASEDFKEREAATKLLEKWDRHAEPLLRAAIQATDSPEARKRLNGLLARLALETATIDDLRAIRAIEAIEWAGTSEAKSLLELWATGGPGSRQTREATAALSRLK